MSRKRQKASDVLRENPPAVGGLITFAEAFPAIRVVGIIVRELDGDRVVRTHRFSRENFPGEYVDCTNPRCYDGGYELAETLRRMGASRETHLEEERMCQGNEGSPKGRREYGPCGHRFSIVADVAYVDSDAAKTSEQ
jgi:hypothetical protein